MYQFILITISDERRQKIIEQFKEFNITQPLICLENPATLTNSTDYFPENMSEKNKKILCCTRDHLRALELSAKDESPEFSIIIEDDVAFHKTKFIDGINEIMNNWDKTVSTHSAKMVSVGWVPCAKYNDYMNVKPMYTLNTISDTKILGDRFVVGTQAYIVRKTDMRNNTPLFGHKTFDSLKRTITSLKYNDLESNECIAIDAFINKVLNHVYVFPPLAVEQDLQSTLRSYSEARHYWIKFYSGCEDYIKSYWSF